MGDTADGYPGVKGIGEKTAIKLIQNHHTVENVIENISTLTPAQQKRSMITLIICIYLNH